jgi:hypothetical protein
VQGQEAGEAEEEGTMKARGLRRFWLGVLCLAALGLGAAAPLAQAAFDDPVFIYRPIYQPPPPPVIPPPPLPPPVGNFEGPCGLAVDAGGDFYVSDYYHHAIDRFGPAPEYLGQHAGVDPLDGPCGLALDGFDNLYVNNFHRNVVRLNTSLPADPGTVVDSAHPTGVAVDPLTGVLYVNDRTHLAVYDASGTELGQVAGGSLVDGYGLALSAYPATAGRLYVPDAGTDTVKVYESTPLGATGPVATIDGSGTPNGHFVSLRNSAVAVDDMTGEVYVADNLQPEYSERGETAIYVFDAAGAYEGRLKYSVENGLPPGLAVDNSGTATQSRVYVTSGSTELGSVYVYGPHSATANAVPLPAGPASPGAGGGGFSSGESTLGAAAVPPPAAPGPGAASAAPAAAAPAAAERARRRAHHKPRRSHRVKNRHHAKRGHR